MRNLLLTTALALPLSFGAAFAQTATDPATTETAPTTETVPMATDDATTDDAATTDMTTEPATDTMATDPATDTTMTTDPAADPMATDMEAGEADQAEAAAASAAAEKVEQQQAQNELRIDWITGTSVQSPQGENIGSISDVIVDGDTSELKAAIVGVGGFLGIGQKQIALPWDQLQINYDAREIVTDLTREEADAAPEYVFRDRQDAPAADGGMAADPAAAPMGTDTGADPAMAPAATDPAMAPADGTMTTDPAMEPAGTTDPAMAPADGAAAPTTEPAPMATEGETTAPAN